MIRCQLTVPLIGVMLVLFHDCATASWPISLPGSDGTITKGPDKLDCDPFPNSEVSLAEAYIKQYPHDSANRLPAGLKTESEIVAWLAYHGSQEGWMLHQRYRYGNYLFLTIRPDTLEKREDPANLGLVIVNVKERTYIGMLWSRT